MASSKISRTDRITIFSVGNGTPVTITLPKVGAYILTGVLYDGAAVAIIRANQEGTYIHTLHSNSHMSFVSNNPGEVTVSNSSSTNLRCSLIDIY